MMLLAALVWPGLVVAGLLGLLSGWLVAARPGGARVDLALSAGLAVALAILHVSTAAGITPLPGRAAYFADSALLHVCAYLLGAVLGGAVRWVTRPRGAPVRPG